MQYESLTTLTDELKTLGFVKVTKQKEWKRRDHREVLVSGYYKRDDRKAKDQIADLETKLINLSAKYHLNTKRIPLFYQKNDAFIWLDLMSAKVDLPR